METFLLGCFVFGLVFTLATTLMGAAHGALDGLGIPHGHDAHVGDGHGWLGTLNLTALMAFVMWFGGAGWLAMKWGPIGVAGVVGVGVGAGVVAYAIVALLFHKLRASETVARVEDYAIEGTVARVSVPATAGGVGEIVFTVQGVQRVEGARAADGQPLEKGAEVVIMGYRNGLALVQDARTYVQGLPTRAHAPEAASEPPRPLPERERES